MITFESVRKAFPDGTVAVDHLDMAIPTGQLTVFVGPSGCGKTTSLRMINRLDDVTQGTISVDGQSVDSVDVLALRRGIGYVMQHSGLFPHRRIRDNIATVPNLLKHDKQKTRQRVDELIELVGLSTDLADRFPHQLSGGQQQRVGVARALAADPPIMLMDEPFAAVDPIVRSRLQDEFLRLQQRLKKTIVFVTHDIDEAIKLGDRIAIFQQGGKLAQYASPEEILAAPANDFVVDFLGGDRELKRLALVSVDKVILDKGCAATVDASSAETKKMALAKAQPQVVILSAEGSPQGWLLTDAIDESKPALKDHDIQSFREILMPGDSLRTATNAIVKSPLDRVPVVDADGCYSGLVDLSIIHGQLT